MTAPRKPSQGLGHATRAEVVPALLATINELRASRQPLVDALALVRESMTTCVGDEWAMEWLGEVWTRVPLDVRALAGDEDAAAELAAEGGQGAAPQHFDKVPDPQDGCHWCACGNRWPCKDAGEVAA